MEHPLQQAVRQIVLDTETTGMNQGAGPHYQGHRIIEIGCVEMINRKLTGNHYHVYINPEMDVDEEAVAVHGITTESLQDKPLFKDIVDEFVAFIRGAEIIAHNAPFDVGFMDHEFRLNMAQPLKTDNICQVTDSLKLAKAKFPGQKNNLDALCRRMGIDNSHRTLHGALLDAEILADVYLLMTGGQTNLALGGESGAGGVVGAEIRRLANRTARLNVVKATQSELTAHNETLDKIDKRAGQAIWRKRLTELNG